jgi:aminoglycoside phosphotransferase family enzyme/predicted kinase
MSARAPLAQAALRQRRIIAALAQQLHATLVETHISWVLLAGHHAYKFKKVLRNDWLDYGDLAARRHCCEEELRLNAPLAPGIYLGVVTVNGSDAHPAIGGDGPVLDVAVRMQRFAQDALWERRLATGELGAVEVRQLGQLLAGFHACAARAGVGTPWGSAAAIGARTTADLVEVDALLAPDSPLRALLAPLARWLAQQHERLVGRFARRKADGWVRECHGDLHCGNVLTLAGQVMVFDGIEFNPGLRWTDVEQDLAFVCMDLDCSGRSDLAARLLDSYLQHSDDYAGVVLQPYYRCQRALVRAKVALLRAGAPQQPGDWAARADLTDAKRAELADATHVDLADAERYLRWAHNVATGRAAKPLLLATHGLSGSGKSTVCDSLVEPLGAVRIRADVVRKRLHGLAPTTRAGAAPGAGLYTEVASRRTYTRMLQQACEVAAGGMPVLLDAAFLQQQQQRALTRLAGRLGAGYLFLDIRAPAAALAARLTARASDPDEPSDADPALLAYQRRASETLQADARAHAVAVDTVQGWGSAQATALAAALRARLALGDDGPRAPRAPARPGPAHAPAATLSGVQPDADPDPDANAAHAGATASADLAHACADADAERDAALKQPL